MEATLQALGGLLVKAIPTFLLVVFLHFYLKKMFFGPMDRVLEQRRRATEGIRRKAEELFERAAAMAGEYEEAVRLARSQIYREQEAARQRLAQEHAQAIHRAREEARAFVRQARAQLEQEQQAAREALQIRSRQLAEQIAETLLGGRAA